MDVLAFAMSPRRGGNTDLMLEVCIRGMRSAGADVVVHRTHDMTIEPCVSCGICENSFGCRFDDDYTALIDRIISCDGMVFASPLYFMNVPARGKAFIDRCQMFWAARYRLALDSFGGRKRFGLLLSCAGAGHGPGGSDVFRGIGDTMTYVFDALGLEKEESVFARHVDTSGEITAHLDVLSAAEKAGFDTVVKYQ